MKPRSLRLFSLIIAPLVLLTSSAPGILPTWGGFGRSDEVYSRIVTEEKLVALTFDDGPHPKYTPEILDLLAEYGIKATFFVIGCNAERYREIVKRISDEGHEIGNHTFTHLVPDKSASSDRLTDELERTDEVIRKLTGKSPSLFRPPTGYCSSCTVEAAKKMGYKTIVWTVDTRDWAHTPEKVIISTVKKEVRGGSIILMHDHIASPSPTPNALRTLIPWLINEGYSFVTVSALIEAEGRD